MKYILPLPFVVALVTGHTVKADDINAPDVKGTPDIVVTAPYVRDRLDALQSTSVLNGDQLQQSLRGTIGETLARLPGVSSTSFGPGASRPVLRGFQGDRIRILIDGIGSIDASSTSTDHAVALDPEGAKRIEVLRGPSTLLYGASAIGGVVNEIDERIPLDRPKGVASGWASALYGTAADEVDVSSGLTAALSKRVLVHVNGAYQDTGDLSIGGFAQSRYLRALEDASDQPEDHARDRLANSDVTNKNISIGSSLLLENGYVGASIGYLDGNYGVPGGEEETRIDLNQLRVDVKAGVTLADGFLDSVKLRFAWADYAHKELDGAVVGTEFKNQGYEGRLDFVQRAIGSWKGAFGVQYASRDFQAIGDEAFVPPNVTNQFGAFALQEAKWGPVAVEGALRYEHTNITAQEIAVDRVFDTLSGSLGANVRLNNVWRIGASASRVTRTPSAEELFSNGPHAATNAFEIGDPGFKTERAWGLEAWLRAVTDRLNLNVTGFWSRFDNYIYEQATGGEMDGLRIFQFRQTDARYYGVELEASYTFIQTEKWSYLADIVGDYVRATNLTTQTPIPRIPAKRLLLGIEAQSNALDARIEAELVDKQNRTAPEELPTEGYATINLSLSWKPWEEERDVKLLFQASNLLDVEARRHASFLKDVAPLAGRDFRFHVRVGF